jgi:hypothetical protein
MKKRFFHRSFTTMIQTVIFVTLVFLVGFSGQTLLARAQAPEPPHSTLDEYGSRPIARSRLIPYKLPLGSTTGESLRLSFPPDYSLSCQDHSIVQGAITPDDAMQVDRLTMWPDASSCQAPTYCPWLNIYPDQGPYRYDIYSFVNSTPANQCVKVTLDASACAGITHLHSSAFLGLYYPASICSNYLADLGPSVGIDPNPEFGPPPLSIGSYSFIVGPAQAYSVVVNQTHKNFFCASYTLTVSPDCQFRKVYLPLISH